MTNILHGGIAKNWKTGNLLTLNMRLEGHWPMIWDLGQNYDEKSNWQKYDDAVVRCRLFLLSGELEMRIQWDSWCHAHACRMPREIINCPLYPVGLWDTTKSLYFFLLLCSTICHGACFFSQASLEKMRVIGLRDGLPKKIAVLLDFVLMRGGGPCPNFLSTFHKLYILGQFGEWDGEGRGDPCPKFFGTLVFKKRGTSCPN